MVDFVASVVVPPVVIGAPAEGTKGFPGLPPFNIVSTSGVGANASVDELVDPLFKANPTVDGNWSVEFRLPGLVIEYTGGMEGNEPPPPTELPFDDDCPPDDPSIPPP